MTCPKCAGLMIRDWFGRMDMAWRCYNCGRYQDLRWEVNRWRSRRGQEERRQARAHAEALFIQLA